MVQENTLATLMADSIAKIIVKPGQVDISTLESKLVAKNAKIKTTDDLIEKGQKHGFLVVVLGRAKYGTVIGKLTVQLTSPEDPGSFDKTSQLKDSSFDCSKGEKSTSKRLSNTKHFGG